MKHKNILRISDLTPQDISLIFDRAKHFSASKIHTPRLANRTIINAFFEDSTRTRISFELAAKRLGAEVINFTTACSSITKKGESFKDTLLTLDAMGTDLFVIRHTDNNACQEAAQYVNCPIINAGTGQEEHPTQALLDAFTIIQNKGKLDGIRVAICGDLKHSRVARSNIQLLQQLGAHISLIAPQEYELPNPPKDTTTFDDMNEGIKNADVIMCLRIQRERFPADEGLSSDDFNRKYGLNHDRLKYAKKDVIIMHPQPLNRGIEITDELADDLTYSVIRQQVTNSVLIRMACLDLILNG